MSEEKKLRSHLKGLSLVSVVVLIWAFYRLHVILEELLRARDFYPLF